MAAGRLTQAQADAMQSFMKERVAWMVDQTAAGPAMMGGGFGPGMMGGGRGPGMMGRGFGRGFGPSA